MYWIFPLSYPSDLLWGAITYSSIWFILSTSRSVFPPENQGTGYLGGDRIGRSLYQVLNNPRGIRRFLYARQIPVTRRAGVITFKKNRWFVFREFCIRQAPDSWNFIPRQAGYILQTGNSCGSIKRFAAGSPTLPEEMHAESFPEPGLFDPNGKGWNVSSLLSRAKPFHGISSTVDIQCPYPIAGDSVAG